MEAQLIEMRCQHPNTVADDGLCTFCTPGGVCIVAVAWCPGCDKRLCAAHLHDPSFGDTAEGRKYYRLRSKIRGLKLDLTQGALF